MNKTIRKALATGIALIGALVVSSAQAVTVSYSGGFNTYASASNSTAGSGTTAAATDSYYVALQGFDASLGDLIDVQISFTSSWYQNGSISAVDSNAEYTTYSYSCGFWNMSVCTGYNYYNDTWGQAKSDSNLTVSLLDPIGSGALSTSSTLSSYCANSISTSGTSSCYDGASTGLMAYDSSLDLSAIALSQFIKPLGDKIDLLFVNDKAIQVWCDNNDVGDMCSGSALGGWNGNVTVTYTYSVSAPATLALLGMGLIGLATVRRKGASA